jgi:hypothetical protein
MATTTTTGVVIGVFDDKRSAERAVTELRKAGFRDDQIGVAARDRAVQEDVRRGADRDGTYAGEGAVIGAATGAAGGVLWGLGIMAGVLPAIGPVIAGGTLAAILASGAVGAAAAGLTGALVGWGIPEEEARYYEREVHAGRIVLSVRADDRADKAFEILRDANARFEPTTSQRFAR